MKKVLFFATLFLLASIPAAFAQTWFYTQPNGQPGGTATYTGPPAQSGGPATYSPLMQTDQLKLFDLGKARQQQQENRLRELEIRRQELELEQTQCSVHETEREAVQAPPKTENEVPPEFRQWFDENKWYSPENPEMQSYADAMGDHFKRTHNGEGGMALLNYVRQEVEKRFPEKFSSAATTSKLGCRDNCKNMFVRGELKPGMTVGQCIKVLCK